MHPKKLKLSEQVAQLEQDYIFEVKYKHDVMTENKALADENKRLVTENEQLNNGIAGLVHTSERRLLYLIVTYLGIFNVGLGWLLFCPTAERVRQNLLTYMDLSTYGY